ncbi:Major facilitator superfamily [Macrophomina phaseolina MS6]|uniref:Major facilitator superfamily n=1 Tax=Macrophomina phaseolina (strain MS6) TaxID=1126212 RepID=K2S1W1_MACPH|nr:Major facilitator superfamily [Macrophomina phaseolina MS6]
MDLLQRLRKHVLRDSLPVTVLEWPYPGAGTPEDPYRVTWIESDPANPYNLSATRKWLITTLTGIQVLAVTFASSAYSGAITEIKAQFGVSTVVVTLGISLFVLGFALGPLIWAPLSEVYGRKLIFLISFGAMTAFDIGAAFAPSFAALAILRFLAGALGSAIMATFGGVIADIFAPSDRGIAVSLLALAPGMGPVLGPIAGGFLGEAGGWRWVLRMIAIFAGGVLVASAAAVPETYAPVLLRRRAARLCAAKGACYRSERDLADGAEKTLARELQTSLGRPWVLLAVEPIVLLLSVYVAIVYGTLYMLFAAFPVVFQVHRGWSAGVSGLAFVGVAVGMLVATLWAIVDNGRYARLCVKHGGMPPPETRLPLTMVGGVALPVGLFWFAWTNYDSIHWIVPIIAGGFIGLGITFILISLINYLVDSYTIFAASVLAANNALRSVFAAAFPLFTPAMYDNLGVHWASSVPAFLALACAPLPFLFHKYGAAIRHKCKYAAESAAFVEKMKERARAEPSMAETSSEKDSDVEAAK